MHFSADNSLDGQECVDNWTLKPYSMWLLTMLFQNHGDQSAALTLFFFQVLHKIVESGCRDLLPFSHKSISEVQHWCWVLKPGSQSVFLLIPKVLDGVEVRALRRPAKVFHTKLRKPCVDGPGLVYGLSTNCWDKVGSTLSNLSLYAKDVLSLWGPNPQPKQPQTKSTQMYVDSVL